MFSCLYFLQTEVSVTGRSPIQTKPWKGSLPQDVSAWLPQHSAHIFLATPGDSAFLYLLLIPHQSRDLLTPRPWGILARGQLPLLQRTKWPSSPWQPPDIPTGVVSVTQPQQEKHHESGKAPPRAGGALAAQGRCHAALRYVFAGTGQSVPAEKQRSRAFGAFLQCYVQAD